MAKHIRITIDVHSHDQLATATMLEINKNVSRLFAEDKHGNLYHNISTHKVTVVPDSQQHYMWSTEGEPRHGTLQDYADDLRDAQYTSLEVSDFLLTPAGDKVHPTLLITSAIINEWLEYAVVAGDDVAYYRIDGRA